MVATSSLNRAEVRDRWVSDATTFAMLTGDSEADSVIRFVKEHMILAEPLADGGISSRESTDDPSWVGVLPLLEDDISLGEPWVGYCHNSAAAFFVPQARSVVVRDCAAWTAWWKGILFLHESHHAYTFVRTPYMWTNRGIYAAKERDTHRFQNRIISCFGGDEYVRAVHSERDRIQSAITRSKESDDYLFDQDTLLRDFSYPDVLDSVFGAQESESEGAARLAHWVIHTRFEAIEVAVQGHKLEKFLDPHNLALELQAKFMGLVYYGE